MVMAIRTEEGLHYVCCMPWETMSSFKAPLDKPSRLCTETADAAAVASVVSLVAEGLVGTGERCAVLVVLPIPLLLLLLLLLLPPAPK